MHELEQTIHDSGTGENVGNTPFVGLERTYTDYIKNQLFTLLSGRSGVRVTSRTLAERDFISKNEVPFFCPGSFFKKSDPEPLLIGLAKIRIPANIKTPFANTQIFSVFY